MKKVILLVAILILGGCGVTAPKTEEVVKNNVVERNGEIRVKSGDEYMFATDTGIINVTSNKFDLDSYMKQKIKISGMYSGTTLYVDKIERVK